MEIFVIVTTRTHSAQVFAYEEVEINCYVSTVPTPIYSRHRDGTFHMMWSAFPEVVSISMLSLQVTQLVNNTVGFETAGLL